jgi:hypothetical protein
MYFCVIQGYELSEFHIAVYTPVSQGTADISFLLLLSDVVYKISSNKALQFIRVFKYIFPVRYIYYLMTTLQGLKRVVYFSINNSTKSCCASSWLLKNIGYLSMHGRRNK